MTVENEIKLAKIEKQLNEAVDAIMTELNIPETLDEAAALNLRYSKLGNELMESDYSDFLLDVAKNGVKTIEEAYCISYIEPSIDPEKLLEGEKSYLYNAVKTLREAIEAAKETANYTRLAKERVGEEFAKGYNNGGDDLGRYIKKSAKRFIKQGMSEEDAEKKACENYDKTAARRTKSGIMSKKEQ